MIDYDFVIIGAGMAGASVASIIGKDAKVLILEAESVAGYHATGRSVAFWTETYGGAGVQPLTSASGDFLENPPEHFSRQSFLKKRGAIHIGQGKDEKLADNMMMDFSRTNVSLERTCRNAIKAVIPKLKSGWDVGICEPECCDIDVAALHQAYLTSAKRAGVDILCNAGLQKALWRDGKWHLDTPKGSYTARYIINAAGAWVDNIAQICGVKPIGIQPYRRTVLQLHVEAKVTENLPLVVALDGSFYFKPETRDRIWLSPHDETLSLACDAAPEEIDTAIAIDRLKKVVDWEILKLERKWAGLRSFAPDRLPAIGHDKNNSNFFWLAGQGGFGIQTAPAISQLAASMLIENHNFKLAEFNAEKYLPSRF